MKNIRLIALSIFIVFALQSFVIVTNSYAQSRGSGATSSITQKDEGLGLIGRIVKRISDAIDRIASVFGGFKKFTSDDQESQNSSVARSAEIPSATYGEEVLPGDELAMVAENPQEAQKQETQAADETPKITENKKEEPKAMPAEENFIVKSVPQSGEQKIKTVASQVNLAPIDIVTTKMITAKNDLNDLGEISKLDTDDELDEKEVKFDNISSVKSSKSISSVSTSTSTTSLAPTPMADDHIEQQPTPEKTELPKADNVDETASIEEHRYITVQQTPQVRSQQTQTRREEVAVPETNNVQERVAQNTRETEQNERESSVRIMPQSGSAERLRVSSTPVDETAAQELRRETTVADNADNEEADQSTEIAVNTSGVEIRDAIVNPSSFTLSYNNERPLITAETINVAEQKIGSNLLRTMPTLVAAEPVIEIPVETITQVVDPDMTVLSMATEVKPICEDNFEYSFQDQKGVKYIKILDDEFILVFSNEGITTVLSICTGSNIACDSERVSNGFIKDACEYRFADTDLTMDAGTIRFSTSVSDRLIYLQQNVLKVTNEASVLVASVNPANMVDRKMIVINPELLKITAGGVTSCTDCIVQTSATPVDGGERSSIAVEGSDTLNPYIEKMLLSGAVQRGVTSKILVEFKAHGSSARSDEVIVSKELSVMYP